MWRFIFFYSGSLAMMAMAFIFKTWTSFQPTHPIFTAEVSTMDRGENQKKRNAFFPWQLVVVFEKVENLWRSIFCPKNKAMVVINPWIPSDSEDFSGLGLEVAKWTWRVHLESILGFINGWEVKDTIFFQSIFKDGNDNDEMFFLHQEVTLFLVLQSRKPTQASLLEGWWASCSFQHSNVSAFSKNAGRCKKVQLSNRKTKI